MTCLDIFPDFILHSSMESKKKLLIKDLNCRYFDAGILGVSALEALFQVR